VVKGVPLRVQWGKPKPMDNMDRETRIANAQAGRGASERRGGGGNAAGKRAITSGNESAGGEMDGLEAVAPPPGQGDVEYAAMAGE
jgi:pre-mRNA-splicing factor RBM22/SLT11